jgi:apolipoprotein N-acyltransferase
LLALSFPKFGHPAFAWVALTPLIVAVVLVPAAQRTARRGFVLGLLTGAVYFAGTLYWLVETMTTFGGLATPVAVFAAALLVAYLSLFPAVFALILSRLSSSIGSAATMACVPPVWIASELGRQYVWDGFPWALLGYSQVSVLPIAQLASVTGVYGLSGLLAATSAAAAFAMMHSGRRRWGTVALTVAAVTACGLWGRDRIQDGTLAATGQSVRVAVVQGNIAQEDKWNPRLRDTIVSRYLDLTRQAIDQGATLIIWPESSLPVYFEEEPGRAGAIRRLAREHGATLLIGSDQVERARPETPVESPDNRFYNAAFLVQPDGSTGAVYRKMHLVPFGEYVPIQQLLFFVGPIVEAVSNFTPGDTPVLLPVGRHKISTAICYEVIYGNLMRAFVAEGSELLTTITNDAWYGRSSAAYQHWDQASMRSIENGRYLARAANTGVSGFVDPYGRVLQKSSLFEQAVLIEDVRYLQRTTIYARFGDLIAWLSLAFTVAALLANSRMRSFSRETRTSARTEATTIEPDTTQRS